MHEASPRPKLDLISKAGIGLGYPAGFRPRCPRCRYDLGGLRDSRCPECGLPFRIVDLIAAWRVKQDHAIDTRNVDMWLTGLLALAALYPTDLSEPVSVVWKAPLLAALWTLAIVWYIRRADELQEEGHRLL